MGESIALLAVLLAGSPAAVALPDEITLFLDEQRVLSAPCRIGRIAVGDSSVIDVKTLGNDRLLLIGAAQGKTTLLFWCSNGQRHSTLVKVLGERAPASPQPVPVKTSQRAATVVDQTGAHDTQVTVVEIPHELSEVTEVTSSGGTLTFVGRDASGRKVTVTIAERPTKPATDGGR